jgi:hypothetical protein
MLFGLLFGAFCTGAGLWGLYHAYLILSMRTKRGYFGHQKVDVTAENHLYVGRYNFIVSLVS